MPFFIPPTLTDRILRAISYLFVSLVGLWIALNPPASITEALGQAMTIIWALMMLCGIPTAWFAYRTKFRGEYTSLIPMFFALLVATAATWFNVPEHPDLLPRVAIASSLLCLLAIRLLGLHRLALALPEG
jgi:hypothetical protein